IRGAIIDEVELRGVADPAPHRAAAILPMVWRPARDPEILGLQGIIEGLEVIADQHVLVGPGRVSPPCDRAVLLVKRSNPTAHPHLAAAIADEDFSLGGERRHGDGLAFADLAELRMPKLLPGLGVQRDGVIVERGDEDLALVICEAAGYNVDKSHLFTRRL